MSWAIVKPDHVGDLILSSAAIRAVAAIRPDVVLFVSVGNVPLARHLFPDLDVRTITFGHLSKGRVEDRIPDLGAFEVVAFLRSDGVITRQWASLRTRAAILPDDTHDDHQSLIDYTVAHALAGRYDIDRLFYGERLERVLGKSLAGPRRIGLSIGSGFHANAWPVTRWLAMAKRLLDGVDGLTIVCGPAEREKAAFMAARLGAPAALDLCVGGTDLGGFLQQVDGLDLVVASDGGTAHLCSLVTPVVSVFGPSPFRRYAPFGRLNRLLTRQMPCSPCCQYASTVVNGCLTTECMTAIEPRDVMPAIGMRLDARSRARSLPPRAGVHLHVGVSHIARERKLAAFHGEMEHGVRSDAA